MRWAAPAAALLACACATWVPGAQRVPDCPGSLLPAAEIPGGDFVLRARARVEAPDVALAFELLVERHGDRVVLVGFDAFGARVFSVVQTGVALETDSRLGRALSIDPENLLRDLHAARFARDRSQERTTVQRAGCHHRTTFVRVEHRELE